MREHFRGRVPPSLLYDASNDVWVREEGSEVVIGATSYGAYFAGEILAFTPKRPGAEIEYDRSLGVVEVAKSLIAIHAPLTLRVTAVNEEAVRKPELINDDPYGAGWMVRGKPVRWDEERPRLVGRDAYVDRVKEAEPDGEIVA
jgi:glycine cleavage system H protein